MFTLMRQLDWLSLLNFEVLHYSRFHVLALEKQGAALNTHIPALGCLQLIVARKRPHYPAYANPLRHNKVKPPISPDRWRHPAISQTGWLSLRPAATIFLRVWGSHSAGARQFITTLVSGMACMVLTHTHLIRCLPNAASRRFHRSTFLRISFPLFPAAFLPVMNPLGTFVAHIDCRCSRHFAMFFNASSATIAAISSIIRLLVVSM